MAWVRLDERFPEHPKALAAGGDAVLLHLCALCYCNRNETDGFIPAAVIKILTDRRTPIKLAMKLVDVGLWDQVDDGFTIHDYLEYQPSRAQRDGERAAARERMAKARRTSTDVRPNSTRSSLNPKFAQPDPDPDPGEEPLTPETSSTRGVPKPGDISTAVANLAGRLKA